MGRRVATVQFSRDVREGRGPQTARWPPEGTRSLKAQQHARLKRDGVSTEPVGSSLAEPGSVDVLGRSGVAAGHQDGAAHEELHRCRQARFQAGSIEGAP